MNIRIVLPEDGDTAKSDLEPPVNHCGDTIEGHLEVTTDRSLEFDINLCFEGVVRTWLSTRNNMQDPSVLPSTAEILVLDETQKLAPDDSTKTYNGDLCIHHIPFFFIVPHELISAQSDMNPLFLKLCPSTKEGLGLWWPMTGKKYRQPMIIYFIRVKALRTDRPVGNIVSSTEKREINIMPYTPIAPPLVMEAFPGEYISYVATPLRLQRWRRSLGTLKISAAEPPPLNIVSNGPRLSSLIVLSVIFEPDRGLDFDMQDTQKMEQVPSLIASKRNPYLRYVEKKKEAEIREYDKIFWRKECEPSFLSRSSSKETWYSTTIMVPINVTKPLLPTFLNPLAARRYALVIRLSIKGVSHRPLELVLPIQVIYWPFETMTYGIDRSETTVDNSSGISTPRELRNTSPPPYGL
ncbi:hypothetical protein B7463_g11920, partial [Scytalidium lignicola]